MIAISQFKPVLPQSAVQPFLKFTPETFDEASTIGQRILEQHGVESTLVGKTLPKLIVPLERDGVNLLPVQEYQRKLHGKIHLLVRDMSWDEHAVVFCRKNGDGLICFDDSVLEIKGEGTAYSAASIKRTRGLGHNRRYPPLAIMAVATSGSCGFKLCEVYIHWQPQDNVTRVVFVDRSQDVVRYGPVVSHAKLRAEGEDLPPFGKLISK